MAEQLLDRPQVGAPLEQVGGERVAQRVGRDSGRERGSTRPHPEPAADVRGREAPSAPRDEQGLLRAIAGLPRGERQPPAGQIALERALARLAERDDPRAPSLALDAHLLGVGVEAHEIEVDDLLGAQPRAVGELEQRPVA